MTACAALVVIRQLLGAVGAAVALLDSIRLAGPVQGFRSCL